MVGRVMVGRGEGKEMVMVGGDLIVRVKLGKAVVLLAVSVAEIETV